jgi:hypothetical protein
MLLSDHAAPVAQPSTVLVPTRPTVAAERLAEQLNTLSQVVETLTYRLLELEERCAAQELQVRAIGERKGAVTELGEETEWRLDDTEQRLQQLESLLSGLDGTAVARHLQPVGHQDRETAVSGQVAMDGPFLDEPEQLFMDEDGYLDEEISA